MPYIMKKRRQEVSESGPGEAGELTYAITMLIEKYRGRFGTKFEVIADVIGALECAKLEFYRRVTAPYEDQKIKDNGDVYFEERGGSSAA
jgi:hypothetical protein